MKGRRRKLLTRGLRITIVSLSNRQDENLRRQRDCARVEHEPDRPPEPDDQLVDEVPGREGEGVPVALRFEFPAKE